MSVFRPKGSKVFRYDFWFQRRRYSKTTGLTNKRQAEQFEIDLIRSMRERAAGVALPDPTDSPRIQEWAEVTLKDARRTNYLPGWPLEHPERLERLLARVLQFFGARPAPHPSAIDSGPPYDLTLAQVATNATWILKFEDWLEAQTVPTGPHPKDGSARARAPMSIQTKNQHRSAVSVMFELAALPIYRARTSVVSNPFKGMPRQRGRRRVVALSIDQIGLWLEHASRHVALAMVIAVLAPKLRLGNILNLRWSQIDAAYDTITVTDHKTARETGRPLIVRVGTQLRQLLQQIRADQPRSQTHVIAYRGRFIENINAGVRAAAERAGIAYGRMTDDGATFHTIRHSLATLLARLQRVDQQRPLTIDERMRMLGHLSFGTTLWYTHLGGDDDLEPTERVGAIAAPLVNVALTRRRRAGTVVGSSLSEP
jgi:integrase